MVKILFKSILGEPKYATLGAAGFDIYSNADFILLPGKFAKIPTGLFLSIPTGYEVQIRSRSGLASKGIIVLNAPGTIDSDYTDEIHILLINHSEHEYSIQRNDRIAQGILSKVEQAIFEYCDTVQSHSTRGGFGSTGK